MPFGYCGNILHVDLTAGTLEVEQPPEPFYRKYMGGSAMGLYYILRGMAAGVDALAPESVITFMLGVTTGAPISGQSRLNVNAKSPLTGAIGDSQAGGFFPADLKFAGFDGILVRGKAEEPVYLVIIDGQAPLHPAAHLRGKVTGDVDALLREEVGDAKAEVLQYGPAAENGVLFSSLVNMANRNNGRTGMGLVLASKQLKAIVVRGHDRVEIADKAALGALSKSGARMMPDNPDVEELGIHGTAGCLMYQNAIGSLPTDNYNRGQFEGCEPVSGEVMSDTILKKRDTCHACVVRFATYTQYFNSLLDTLELCQFVWGPAWTLYGPSELVELVRAVTGWKVSLFELMKVGERRLNLLRAFNAREGLDRSQDKLPKKFFKPLQGSGPTAGVAVDRETFERALDFYYQINGWTEDGVPTRGKLVELGLEWVLEEKESLPRIDTNFH